MTTTEHNNDSTPHHLVDQFELAHVLQISPGAVMAMAKRNALPSYRVGKRSLRFDVDECLRALRNESMQHQEGAA